MKTAISGACLLLMMVGVVDVKAATETALPIDRLQPRKIPGFEGRGKTASAAANIAKSACQCLNAYLIEKAVTTSLTKNDKVIAQLLDNSGQKGVLVKVAIQKLDGEAPIYSVVGEGSWIIGAGSSPLAVNIAYKQMDQLEPGLSPKATLDLDQSYYLWFSKEGKNVVAHMENARGIVSETARVFADEKLTEAVNEFVQAEALGAAATHLEKTAKDKAVRQKLTELREQLEKDDAKIKQIEDNLQKELERARRAQSVARTLSLMSTAMTLASQVATIKQSLGADTPASIDSATNNAELQKILNDMNIGSADKATQLQIQYNSISSERFGLRRDQLTIIKTSGYPSTSVPQLGKP